MFIGLLRLRESPRTGPQVQKLFRSASRFQLCAGLSTYRIFKSVQVLVNTAGGLADEVVTSTTVECRIDR